jgi:hypothetical protein
MCWGRVLKNGVLLDLCYPVVYSLCEALRQSMRRPTQRLYYGREYRFSGWHGGYCFLWEWRICGVHLLACLRRCYLRWHEAVFKLLEAEVDNLKKPSSEAALKAGTFPHADPGMWSQMYPLLAAALVESAWEDGTPKLAGRVSYTPQRGRWCVTLKAPGTGLMLEVEVECPEDAPAALEAALKLDPSPWRPDPWEKVQQARRKPK